MKNTDTTVRVAAIGVAAVIATTLFSAIVASMPPEFGEAFASSRAAAPIEVAIVPSRIEVVGVRSQDTAANDVQAEPARPRS
ncbi:MAG: hypothetical protein KJ018_03760 [Burkholderiales bacterium]|nr:hypothetical protein [Burkholderiales bacterium]